MVLSNLLAWSIWITAAYAKGKGGGSSGGSSGGSGSSYISSQCRDTSIDIVPGSYGSRILGTAWWWENNYRMVTVNQDNSTLNTLMNENEPINWAFEIYDAYFNGSLSVSIDPPANQSSLCPKWTSQVLNDAYLRIGPQQRGTTSRKGYDSNPYYLRLGRTFKDLSCPTTPNDLYASFESSRDGFKSGQVWTLGAKKGSGDELDLTGDITATKANFANYFNYQVNSSAEGANVSTSCATSFKLRSLLQANHVSLTGTVSPSKAFISFEIASGPSPYTSSRTLSGWVIRGTFNGTWWNQGAKLVTSGDSLNTEGEAKRIKVDNRTWIQKNLKYIIIAVAVVTVLALALCIWRCVKRCSGRNKKKQSEVVYGTP